MKRSLSSYNCTCCATTLCISFISLHLLVKKGQIGVIVIFIGWQLRSFSCNKRLSHTVLVAVVASYVYALVCRFPYWEPGSASSLPFMAACLSIEFTAMSHPRQTKPQHHTPEYFQISIRDMMKWNNGHIVGCNDIISSSRPRLWPRLVIFGVTSLETLVMPCVSAAGKLSHASPLWT